MLSLGEGRTGLHVPKPSKGGGAYIIKPMRMMGKGMFAMQNIKMDEIILAEHPLLIRLGGLFPPSLEMKKREAELRKYSQEDMEQVFLFERELELGVAVGRMDPERMEKFWGLKNSREKDGGGLLCGIAHTNMYGCWELWDGEAEPGPQKLREIYSMVCDVGSQINHRLDSGFFNGV